MRQPVRARKKRKRSLSQRFNSLIAQLWVWSGNANINANISRFKSQWRDVLMTIF